MANGRVVVDAPTRHPVVGGLLGAVDVHDFTDPHMAQGVAYNLDPAVMPQLAPNLCWSDIPANQMATSKNYGGIDIADPSFTFALYGAIECGLLGSDEADFRRRAEQSLLGGEDVVLAMQFYNKFLSGADEIDYRMWTVEQAIGLLEQEIGMNYPFRPVLHMDRYVAALASKDVVEWDVDHMRTKQGTPVANSAGYPTNLTEPSIFATGQINIWRSPISHTMVVSPSTNRRYALAERIYSITVEGPIYKALALVPTPEEP